MSYPGGKAGAGVYQAIINQMPPHDTYIELFLGGGAIIRHKRPAAVSHGVELDADAFRAFSPDLKFWCEHPPISTSHRRFTLTWPQGDGKPTGRRRQELLTIHHQDALTYLRSLDCSTAGRVLVYADPPYLLEVRSTRSKIYDCEFGTWFEHQELLEILTGVQAMVMISGYDHPFYNEKLATWRRVEFQGISRGGPRTEVLWMNYAEPVELHDYRYLGSNYRERETIKKRQKRWHKNLRAMNAMERYAMLSMIDDYKRELSSAADTAANGDASDVVLENESGARTADTGDAAGVTARRDDARAALTADVDAPNGFRGRDLTEHPTRPDVVQEDTAKSGDTNVIRRRELLAESVLRRLTVALAPSPEQIAPRAGLSFQPTSRNGKPRPVTRADLIKAENALEERVRRYEFLRSKTAVGPTADDVHSWNSVAVNIRLVHNHISWSKAEVDAYREALKLEPIIDDRIVFVESEFRYRHFDFPGLFVRWPQGTRPLLIDDDLDVEAAIVSFREMNAGDPAPTKKARRSREVANAR